MTTKAQQFRETITEVVFVAFAGKQSTEFFFDATPDQCTKFIWDNICDTAVIIFINEYKIESYTPVYGFKKKLTIEELGKKIGK